jgi:osmotically-inducible protein OsmY
MSTRRAGCGLTALLFLFVTAPAQVLAAQGAPVTSARGEGDAALTREVADAVIGSPLFTIFDDVGVRVAGGVATLTGFVTTSGKSKEFTALASRVRGVHQVVNRIETLPASMMDDELRADIAMRIRIHPVFYKYAKLRIGPVHIIVRDGQVMLTGVVASEVERRTADTIARHASGTWSVDNQLRLKEPQD